MEEDGWTVVKTHKGRKKNRDAGSGTTVGAVTAGAALALKAKAAKKDKESLSTDFYRFQRREKKRNEVSARAGIASMLWHVSSRHDSIA